MRGRNEVWAGDIAYIWAAEDWSFLAVAIDLYAGRVVGWAIADNIRPELPFQALRRALELRGTAASIVFYSDRGSQYARRAYRRVLASHELAPATAMRTAPLELLRVAQEGMCTATTLRHTHRGARRCRGLHRRLLQPAAAALEQRVPQPHRPRTSIRSGGGRLSEHATPSTAAEPFHPRAPKAQRRQLAIRLLTYCAIALIS